MAIPTGISKPEKPQLKVEQNKRKRAQNFKEKYPNARNVPETLSRGQHRKLLDDLQGVEKNIPKNVEKKKKRRPKKTKR